MFEITAAFTGPRPHRFPFRNNEEHPDCLRIKAALREQVLRLYGIGVRRFLSGACIGVDMWAGEIVLSLMETCSDMELHCIIPFEAQAANWNERQRDRYFSMIERCTRAVELSTRFYDGCYRDRNFHLVSNAKYLIAVYDKESKVRGGTGQTVFMALNMGRSITSIHPKTCAVLTEADFP